MSYGLKELSVRSETGLALGVRLRLPVATLEINQTNFTDHP